MYMNLKTKSLETCIPKFSNIILLFVWNIILASESVQPVADWGEDHSTSVVRSNRRSTVISGITHSPLNTVNTDLCLFPMQTYQLYFKQLLSCFEGKSQKQQKYSISHLLLNRQVHQCKNIFFVHDILEMLFIMFELSLETSIDSIRSWSINMCAWVLS